MREVLVLFLFRFLFCSAQEAYKGVVRLDSSNFFKIIKAYNGPVLIKFDKTSFGKKEDAFKELATEVHKLGQRTDSLLVEVLVKDKDDPNFKLSEKYNVKIEDMPVYVLYKRGRKTSVRMTTSVKAGHLFRFLRLHTGIPIKLRHTVALFDSMVRQLFHAKNPQQRNAVVSQLTQSLVNANEEEKQSGVIYERLMKKVMVKGRAFVSSEIKRIKGLIESGKLAKKLKHKMYRTLDVLVIFLGEESRKPAKFKRVNRI